VSDVLVIGGGPAGLSAGIAFAHRGASVTIYEQADAAIEKPCGEGLLPSAVEQLCGLGLDRSLLLSAGQPLLGVRYFSQLGTSAGARFAEGSGLGLRRQALQALLRSLALGTAGLRLCRAEARVIRDSRGVCRVQTAGGVVVTPRLIVAADGLHSRTRKDADLASRRPRPLRYGARQHFEIEPWTNHVEVYFGPAAEAYVTPTQPNQINLAVLWSGERRAETAQVCRSAPQLLRAFPALAQRLGSARALGDMRGAGPLGVQVPEPARDGLVLLGDAAGYVDAITGEGVGLAVAKARLLAQLVGPALRLPGAQLTLRQLKPYVAAARKLERHHVTLTKLVLLASRSPWLIEHAVRALAADTRLFSDLLTVNQGGASPLSPAVHALLRLLQSRAGVALPRRTRG
jgi:flavin-dependent dehydrogenase